MRRPLEDMPRCPRCNGILNRPTIDARPLEVFGQRWVFSVTRRVCPLCEYVHDVPHVERSYVTDIATEERAR